MIIEKKYRRNLILGSVLFFLLLVVSAIASLISITKLVNAQKMVSHTQTVILKLENIISRVKDAETGQRGFLLTGETTFLEPYEGAKGDVWTSFNDLSILTSDNPDQQKDLSHLSDVISIRFSLLEQSLSQKRAGIPFDVNNIEKGRIYMMNLRKVINRMEQREQLLLKQRTGDLGFFAGYTPVLIIFASLLGILVTVLFYFRLKSDYQTRLEMQKQLMEKEKQIAQKVEVVKEFAEKVADGDYKHRIDPSDLL